MSLRLIKHKESDNNNEIDVVFYVHGGAYMGQSPQLHEDYLLEFSKHLGPSVAIVAPAYRLAPENRFPAGLQDVLDSYSWLTGSKEVSEVLGFEVGNITVAGDSAGPTFLLSMMETLVEAKKKWPEEEVRLPKAFVSFYGIFSLEMAFYPSMVLSALETVLTPWTLGTSFASAYVEQEDTKLDRFQSAGELLNCPHVSKFIQMTKSIYLSPIKYGDFEAFHKVALTVVTSSTCLFSDESVALAKKWPGKATLRVVDRLPHGFLNFSAFSKSAFEAVLLCAVELQRSFQA
jgi:acetyl esterase/lipase